MQDGGKKNEKNVQFCKEKERKKEGDRYVCMTSESYLRMQQKIMYHSEQKK